MQLAWAWASPIMGARDSWLRSGSGYWRIVSNKMCEITHALSLVPRSRCASTKCSHCSYSSFFPPSCNWRARAYWSKKLGEFELSESASSES